MSKTRKFYVQGYPVLVDECDWDVVQSRNWKVSKKGRTHYVISSDGKGSYLHRLITSAAEYEVVDHINSAGLDNRQLNLRVGTSFENSQNLRKFKNNTSGFVGVYWAAYTKRWRAMLMYQYKSFHLGYFASREEAALAYNAGILRILPPEHSKLRKLNVVTGETNENKEAA